MKILIVIPTQKEFDFFLKSCNEHGFRAEDSTIGRLPVVQFPDLDLTLASGGLGKVQFAVQAQHLLDACPDWDLVICAGAAGAIVDTVSIGDVIVSTEIVEHDIKKIGSPFLPRFKCPESILADSNSVSSGSDLFQVHFGPIASGDEDIMDTERRRRLHELTGGLAVGWEGAGGARACQFNDTPFIEIRGITDSADNDAASDFKMNLKSAMRNVATLITSWAREVASSERAG